MSQKLQVFKCDSCGSIFEALHASDCDPSCCGKPMRALAENSTDAAKEKHVPVIEAKSDGVLVRVGSVAHPMEADHFIEWIELLVAAPTGASPRRIAPISSPAISRRLSSLSRQPRSGRASTATSMASGRLNKGGRE